MVLIFPYRHRYRYRHRRSLVHQCRVLFAFSAAMALLRRFVMCLDCRMATIFVSVGCVNNEMIKSATSLTPWQCVVFSFFI